MKTHLKALRHVAKKALESKRGTCTATSCSCNDRAKAWHEFHQQAHPALIIHLVDELLKETA